jgi:S1-C subfamily serine protease
MNFGGTVVPFILFIKRREKMRAHKIALFCFFCFLHVVNLGFAQDVSALHVSHDSTVRISSNLAKSSGSGALIGDRLVLTCLHVVVSVQPAANNSVSLAALPDLVVTMPSGESIPATLISMPTQADSAPADHDFAFLRLSRKPTNGYKTVPLAGEKAEPELGDEVVFSGYPLNVPGMVTHRGMVSGKDDQRDLIFIEASINKGNSGGSLLNRKGEIIGIVSLREGGITQALAQLREQINAQQASGMQVTMMGIDPMTSYKALIDTIDLYISTGIGYAHSIRFASEYLRRHPQLRAAN